LEKTLLEDPLLLKTPIVRNGKEATVGYAPETWAAWLA
jgi:arsenate reductase-like glutaredoxin family protein